MSTPLADLASHLGHTETDPEWTATSVPPIPPERFGKDHWSTFAYVETRAVDHRGILAHDHMRCHGRRHPLLLAAKRLTSADGSAYPTILADGEATDHDDYDCLDDLRAAGLLTVTMPRRVKPGGRAFVNAYGKRVAHVDLLTGLEEARLAAHAAWGLTDLGHEVAGLLRKHKAAGGTWSGFAAEARAFLAARS